MIPNNARHLRLTAAAGTKLAVTSSGVDQSGKMPDFLSPDSSLHPDGRTSHAALLRQAHHSLRNIRYCSPPWRSGQCLSPDVAGQPFSPFCPARCLGRPLPHQQADRKQAAPTPINLWSQDLYPVTLFGITAPFGRLPKQSDAIPKREVRYLFVPHPFATNYHFGYPSR